MVCAAHLSIKRAGFLRRRGGSLGISAQGQRLANTLGDKYDFDDLFEAMRLDKKARKNGKLRFVLLKRIGEAVISNAVTDRGSEEVVKCLPLTRASSANTRGHGFLVCQRRKYVVQDGRKRRTRDQFGRLESRRRSASWTSSFVGTLKHIARAWSM